MLSSKDLKKERDGAQGDPRKRVLGCESKMCSLWVRSEAGALEEPARSVVEHAQKIKAGKGWESVHRLKRGEAPVSFHASLKRETTAKCSSEK